jgi:hypothetical protein
MGLRIRYNWLTNVPSGLCYKKRTKAEGQEEWIK